MKGISVVKSAALGVFLTGPVTAEPVAICIAATFDMTAVDELSAVSETSLFVAADGTLSRSSIDLVDPISGERTTWHDSTVFETASNQLPRALTGGADHERGDCGSVRFLRIETTVVNADGTYFSLDTDCPAFEVTEYFLDLAGWMGVPVSGYVDLEISAPLGVSLCEGLAVGS
ncbi:MAG: hypothetical protein AAGF88_12985 [Pseudomonadota bacterium]